MNVPGIARGWQPRPERLEAAPSSYNASLAAVWFLRLERMTASVLRFFDQIDDRFVLVRFMVKLSTQSVVMHNDSCTRRCSHDFAAIYGPGGVVVVNIRSMS
jgi:hypothetical protein